MPNKNGFDRANTMSAPVTALIDNLANYIPVGCLRIDRRAWGLTPKIWAHLETQTVFKRPPFPSGGNPIKALALPEGFDCVLLWKSFFQSLRLLHASGWITAEFSRKDADLGQFRVYVLPDDLGRGLVNRDDATMRRYLCRLLGELDLSRSTWIGEWATTDPILHVDSEMDEGAAEQQISLSELYNNLVSPSPDSRLVKDPYAQAAMENILEGHLDGLTSEMLPYQRRSAAMMLQRESQPILSLDPRLRQLKDMNGIIWYCDIVTGICLREPRLYESPRGGICAEAMGLGKTLICLCLILGTRNQTPRIPVEFSVGSLPKRRRVGSLIDMVASTIGRSGIPWKHYFGTSVNALDYSQCTDAIRRNPGYYVVGATASQRSLRRPAPVGQPRKILLSAATLVVVPTNLCQQWIFEIRKHTSGLKVLKMTSFKKSLPPANELIDYDVILFSRQRFEQESKGAGDISNENNVSHEINCAIYSTSSEKGSCSCGTIVNSPLRDIHFKRLITDEGHTMGNSSGSNRSQAVVVVDFLKVSARWVVSGTPTPGLYGDVALSIVDPFPSDELRPNVTPTAVASSDPTFPDENDEDVYTKNYDKERKDLEKLGNIAAVYLKAAPWAGSGEAALWSQYIMQPRHGAKSHGTTACLQATLEGMIVRHRGQDIEKELQLPPLYQRTVYLEGSYLDKCSLNLFSLMIISNAVTSERRDADYLFHPRQRKALASLVANLRHATFFWSGFTRDDVQVTIDIAQKFIYKGEIRVSESDHHLLRDIVRLGSRILSSDIWLLAAKTHEMPLCIENNGSSEIRKSWSLDGSGTNPSLIGITQLHQLQRFVDTRVEDGDDFPGLEEAGRKAIESLYESLEPSTSRSSNMAKLKRKFSSLSGGVNPGTDTSPGKRKRPAAITQPMKSTKVLTTRPRIPNASSEKSQNLTEVLAPLQVPLQSNAVTQQLEEVLSYAAQREARQAVLDSILQSADSLNVLPELFTTAPSTAKGVSNGNGNHQFSETKLATEQSNIRSSMLAATITSTASAKLSYLIDQTLEHHKEEKIIIFYEGDNIAYYIAQALEAVGVEHLIYAKTLSSERRSQYVVSFNSNPIFRCLLMDVSQAAFGLDVSSASRVYFVSPVMSKQVEAQAVKRAHRIGQRRPVYVETLVLRGSIEEVMIERRNSMTTDEQQKCKTVLHDQTLYDWIKNVRFFDLPEHDLPKTEQMAKLASPPPVFGRRERLVGDTGLVNSPILTSPKRARRKDNEPTTPSKTPDLDFGEGVQAVRDQRHTPASGDLRDTLEIESLFP